jgi:hypothetical protein
MTINLKKLFISILYGNRIGYLLFSAAYPTYFHSYPLKFKSVLGISLLITNYFIWRYS